MNGMLPLRDIKGLLNIPDYYLYYFFSSIALSLIAFITLVYFLYNVIMFYKNKKLALKQLLKDITLLNLDDSKKFAYQWTKYTNKIQYEFKVLKIKNHLSTLNDMILFSNSLDLYKYKPKNDKLDDSTISEFSKLKEKILAISV